jgi:serine/threonine protein kinase
MTTVHESGQTTAGVTAEEPRLPRRSAATRLRSGDRVGTLEIVGLLASGGMGELYDTIDMTLGRPAVLKVLHRRHAGRWDFAERLVREASLLAEVRCPCVPIVYGAGALEDGRPYFVMERLRGRDLRAELRRVGVMSVPTAVRLVREVLSTLASIHARGIVHRDVKLDNLLFSDDGRLMLLDFGLACRIDDALRTTGRGVALGTLRWMAPEQHRAEEVDARTDVYAAGLVLYELVAGRGPFDHLGPSEDVWRHAHCRLVPAPPSEYAPQVVPTSLEGIIERALAKRAEDRFPSAGAMARALARVLPYYADDAPTIADAPMQEEEPLRGIRD